MDLYIENLGEKEGGIFCIPLFLSNDFKDNRKNYYRQKLEKSENYAFGRLIESDKTDGDLIEIFNFIGEIPSSAEIVINSGRMFRPLHIAMAFEKKRWRFVFHDDNYDREKDSNYSKITFLLGDEIFPELWQGGVKHETESYDTTLYDEWIVYLPVQIEDKIRAMKEEKCLNF